jgi:hypothetical protein
MKLRIKGNSLRLRIAQSEMAELINTGTIEDTIKFASSADAKLTYAIRLSNSAENIRLEYTPQRVTVLLSTEAAKRWATSNEVGIYGSSETGAGPLELLVEKDFACLDGNDPHDEDAFPNPSAGSACPPR